MKLTCSKYNEKVDSEHAVCRHPGDYCQYRTSCMIIFLEKENRRNVSGGIAEKSEQEHVKE